VLLWFVGMSAVLVWAVFRDPAIDYRLVVAGSVLPDAVDALSGRAFLLHTLLFSVVLLVTVMLLTRRRRLARRRYLALPIGTFAHLVLDGVWTRTHLFWWPSFGTAFEAGPLPSLARPVWLVAVLEVAGLVAAAWWCRHFRLFEPDRRRTFVRTGSLGREFRPDP
jgi:membrane-bound metal-dependent hydrolase YbcI (DUF457 family)